MFFFVFEQQAIDDMTSKCNAWDGVKHTTNKLTNEMSERKKEEIVAH